MFNLAKIAPDWQPFINQALAAMDQIYLAELDKNPDWLPGKDAIFNAFTLPLSKTQYILFGESPYPRPTSANGFAFWDAAVDTLWSPTGMSRPVNRATSLRNFLKMLMVANGSLSAQNTSQPAIATLDKQAWVSTIDALFANLLSSGFLLLNATLVLSDQAVQHEGRYWEPFVKSLLAQLAAEKKSIQLILMGKVAEKIQPLAEQYQFPYLCAEHPYNLSFITNPNMQSFFKPFNLLKKRDKLHFCKE